jgi:hypothetical protein
VLAACSEERAVNVPSVPEAETLGNFPITRAPGPATNEENFINTARLIVFRSQGQTNAGRMLVNKLLTGSPALPQNISFHELVLIGRIDIFIICNEYASWNLDQPTLTPAEIKNKELAFSSYPQCNSNIHIPMYGYYENVTIDEYGNLSMSGQSLDLITVPNVTRCFAKVVVSMDFTAPNPVPDLGSLRIERMPRKSYLGAQNYTFWNTSDYFDGTYNPGLSIDAVDSPSTGRIKRTYTAYIPEYLPDINSIKTTLSLFAAGKTHYIILSDKMDTMTQTQLQNTIQLSDLRVSRNKCYNVKITNINNNNIVFSVSVDGWVAETVHLQ